MFLAVVVVPCTGTAQSKANAQSDLQASEKESSEEKPAPLTPSSFERDPDDPKEESNASVAEPKDESAESPQTSAQFRALIHIKRAEALFGSDNYEAALAEYQQAHDVLIGHPKQYQTLHNIGLCHERLFRYTQALRYLTDWDRQEGPPSDL